MPPFVPLRTTLRPAAVRLHVGLGVSDVRRSVDFYTALLDTPPDKRRPGYARFSPRRPALVLSLIETASAGAPRPPTHYGLRVDSTREVREAIDRLGAAGLAPLPELGVTCCHATQDKVWVRDPDGHAWEIYTVLDDAPAEADVDDDAAESCCASPCCGVVP